MVTVLRERRDFIVPQRFGAAGDAIYISSLSVTLNSNVVNWSGGAFTPSHVGKSIFIAGGLANGGCLTATISTYNSATQVVISTNVTAATGTKTAVVGTDDTTAIARALAYATARGKAVILDGVFISGPIAMPSTGAIIGSSKEAAKLYLKPGSATASKYLIGLAATSTERIAVEDLTLSGLNTFQTNGSGVALTDINTIDLTGGVVTGDLYGMDRHHVRGVSIRAASRAALKYLAHADSGGAVFNDINVIGGIYGMDINGPGVNVSGVNVTVSGAGFYLGSSTIGGLFSNCAAYKTGYSIMPGQSGVGESACWFLNGATSNDFSACKGQEGWSAIWVLTSAHRNNFQGCRAADPGCLFADGLGSNNSGEIRAAWYLNASNDNRFDVSAGILGHATSYGTHALYATGSCNDNTGRIITNKNTTWATSKIGRSHTGENNSLVIDDEPLDANEDSHIDNIRFLNGSYF